MQAYEISMCLATFKISKQMKKKNKIIVIFSLIVCANRKCFVTMHRQKVNRLFRLVVIDLGF